jgi:uncharacterized membrane protein
MPKRDRKRGRVNNSRPAAVPYRPPTQQPVSIVELRAEHFAGPLPHPDILLKYEEIQVGFADRIITMAEKQTNHRIESERFTVHWDAWRANAGLVAGLIVYLAFVYGSVHLIEGGHSASGLTLGLTPLAALVGAFVYGNQSRKEERRERMAALSGEPPQQQRRDRR